jgi:penicillin-binding protein 1A
VQGGSTITQQTAKLMFLDAERTWQRKWRELLLALSLEAEYSKDEILNLYLNRAYLGSGNYGVEMASWDYFGKSARDATLSEAAMLAGLLRAPSRYAPTRDQQLAQRRAGVVLDAMVATGAISEAEGQRAKEFPAELAPPLEQPVSSYFIDWIYRQLPDSLSNLNNDLNIITTLDPHAQAAAERSIEEAMNASGEQLAGTQAALVMLAPNGAIRAMVGGRSYAGSQFNRATDARRQPGSAFKPFVYMAAMEQGYAPENIFYDEPVAVDDWSPDNYAGKYLGRVTLSEALAKSINSVAVKLSEAVGRDKVIATAKRNGISARLEPVASLPLGTHEISLLELTAAYAPFANGGFRAPPFGLVEISTAAGELLYRHRPPIDTRVAGRRTVRDMNLMLSEVMSTGTGRAGALPDWPAAGKTGTSQNASDAWFIGYTSELVAGVWLGNDDNSSMGTMTGGRVPAQIWRATLERVHPDGEPTALPYTEADAPIRPRGDLENMIVRALDESPRPGIYSPRGFPHNRIIRMNPDPYPDHYSDP